VTELAPSAPLATARAPSDLSVPADTAAIGPSALRAATVLVVLMVIDRPAPIVTTVPVALMVIARPVMTVTTVLVVLMVIDRPAPIVMTALAVLTVTARLALTARGKTADLFASVAAPVTPPVTRAP
jgi:hypothetical protein